MVVYTHTVLIASDFEQNNVGSTHITINIVTE